MITYLTGNIFDSPADALVNAVNTLGVMGKGLAKQFKIRYPKNYQWVQTMLNSSVWHIGELIIVQDGDKLIINFPTKKEWWLKSEYTYIEAGLLSLYCNCGYHKIKSIAIPALGCGEGGLAWEKVKMLMERYLNHLSIDIFIYEPQ